jgi:hypothetical protein
VRRKAELARIRPFSELLSGLAKYLKRAPLRVETKSVLLRKANNWGASGLLTVAGPYFVVKATLVAEAAAASEVLRSMVALG